MHPIFILLRKDLQTFFKDRVAVGLTFILPLVLIFIFGQAFGIGRSSSGPSGVLLAVAQENNDPALDRLVSALEKDQTFRVRRTWTDEAGVEQPYTEARIREEIAANRLRFGLLLPADQLTVETPAVRLKLLLNPRNEIETQTVTGLLQKTIFTGAPEIMAKSLRLQGQAFLGETGIDTFFDDMSSVIATSFGLDEEELRNNFELDSWFTDDAIAGALSGEGGEQADDTTAAFFDEIMQFEQEPVTGLNLTNQSATRAVGGWAMMFLLFSVAGAATSLFDERKAGLFMRLLSYPVHRVHILWSKYLFFIGLGLCQLASVFIYAWFLYRIDLWPQFGPLLVVCLFASAACTSFGMFIAAVSPTQAVANGLSTFLILTMSAVGGAWFPVSFMPEFMQKVSQITLVYWAQEGFLRVLFQGESVLQILPVLGVLSLICGVLIAVSLWRFRVGNLFD